MRRRVLAGLSALLLIGGLVMWFGKYRTRPTEGGGGETKQGGGKGDGRSLAERKRAERRDAPVDLTPARLAGTVTAKTDGRPLAGADVTLTKAKRDGADDDEDEPHHVVTGADGAWTFPEVAPGRWIVTAGFEGYVPASTDELTLKPGEGKSGITLALDAGGMLVTGIVSDIGGGPIADALVTATTFGWGRGLGSLSTVTKADGTFRVTVTSEATMVVATHPLYASAQATARPPGPVKLELLLIPGGTISGRVILRDGQRPVPGAHVEADPDSRSGMASARVATADVEGRFTLKGVAPGHFALTATGKRAASSEPVHVDLGVGEEVTDVEIVLDAAYTVSGFVVERGSERGLAGVDVGGLSMRARTFVAAQRPTEPDGYFEIDGVRPGTYMVYAGGGDGFLPSIMTKNFAVTDKDVTDLVIELDPAVTISGRVEPPQVTQLSLAMDDVGFGNMGAAIAIGQVHGMSAADGTFTLRGIPDGSFKVNAKAESGQKGSTPVKVAGKAIDGVVVKMEDRASIAGKVVDKGGRGIGGVRVRASKKHEAGEGMQLDFDELMGGGAATADDGAFTVRGLEPGTYDLRVVGPGGKPKTPVSVTVAAAEAKTGVTIVIDRADGVIRGLVLGTDGKPAADAFVSYTRSKIVPPPGAPTTTKNTVSITISSGDSGGSASVSSDDVADDDDPMSFLSLDDAKPILTDANGRFTIQGLYPAAYDVTAEALRGAGRATVTQVKPGASITLRLEQLGGLTGTVTSSAGPIKEYTLTADGPVTQTARGQADGRYEITRLAPGAYDLKVVGPEGAGTGKATVTPGAPTTANIVVAPWGHVMGTLIDARTTKPLAGTRVVAMTKDVFDEESLFQSFVGGSGPQTDGGGRFDVGRLGPGEGALLMMPGLLAGGGPTTAARFKLADGERKDLGAVKVLLPPPDAAVKGTIGMAVDSGKWASSPRWGNQYSPDIGGGDHALWVSAVEAGGPAANAGLVVGERILWIDGFKVGPGEIDPDGVGGIVAPGKVAVGQVVKVRVLRGGINPVPVDVTLTAVPVIAPK